MAGLSVKRTWAGPRAGLVCVQASPTGRTLATQGTKIFQPRKNNLHSRLALCDHHIAGAQTEGTMEQLAGFMPQQKLDEEESREELLTHPCDLENRLNRPL